MDCFISNDVAMPKIDFNIIDAVVAEWLRRLTRNQFPSGSVGSNPTDCETFSAFQLFLTERNIGAKLGLL